MSVTLINRFQVPAGREEEFLALWQQVNDYMRKKRGYIGHRLHRSLAPDAEYRFINVAEWVSQDDFNAAHDDCFRALVAQAAWRGFPSSPAFYEVVHQGTSDRH